jgi:hypothetical protein
MAHSVPHRAWEPFHLGDGALHPDNDLGPGEPGSVIQYGRDEEVDRRLAAQKPVAAMMEPLRCVPAIDPSLGASP